MSKHEKKEKKSALKIQLLGAVGMLLIAIVALSGATYAWFTFVSNPQVSAIDMYVQAANNILFSPYTKVDMDPQTDGYGTTDNNADNAYTLGNYSDPYNDPSLWFATVTQKMIQDGTDESGTPIIDPNYIQPKSFPSLTGTGMENNSSIWNTLTGGRDFFTRTINPDGTPAQYVAAGTADDPLNDAAGNGYIQFSLWVKSNTDGILFLDGNQSSALAIDSAGGDPLTGQTDKRQFIEDAIRVGFYTTSEGSAAATPADPRAVIWEPNSTEHLPTWYGGPGGTAKLDTLAITQPTAIPTPDPLTGLSTEDMTVGGEGGKQLQTTWDFTPAGTNLKDSEIAVCALKGGSAVKVTFAIWVEGADADTLNAVANSFFRTALVFGEDSTSPVSSIKDN